MDTMAPEPSSPTTGLPTDRAAAMTVLAIGMHDVLGDGRRIAPTTPVLDYLVGAAGYDIDLSDLAQYLENRFDVTFTDDDWRFLSGEQLTDSDAERQTRYAPCITFGQLADVIAHRVDVSAPRPAIILGATSAAAGGFQALKSIVRKLAPLSPRFGPSTPILDIINFESLPIFWATVCRRNPTHVPALGASHRFLQLALATFALTLAISFTLGWWIGGPATIRSGLFNLCAFVASATIAPILGALFRRACDAFPALARRYRRAEALLPNDIVTFGDLAKLVGAEDAGWCIHCGYNMTGISPKRCPECGCDPRPRIEPPDASFVETTRRITALLSAPGAAADPLDGATRICDVIPDPLGANTSRLAASYEQIERAFDITITRDDQDFLTGRSICKSDADWLERFAPLFTIDRLATFVAHKSASIRVAPITLLGVSSRTAGAFREIERVAKEVAPKVKPFGPSVRIVDRLGAGAIARMWRRVRWHCPERIPALKTITRDVRGGDFIESRLIIASGVAALAIVGYIAGWPGVSTSGVSQTTSIIVIVLLVLLLWGLTLLLLIVADRAARQIFVRRRFGRSMLPYDIETFADLAKLMSGERGGWCDGCSYDLTGATSERCPECGRVFR